MSLFPFGYLDWNQRETSYIISYISYIDVSPILMSLQLGHNAGVTTDARAKSAPWRNVLRDHTKIQQLWSQHMKGSTTISAPQHFVATQLECCLLPFWHPRRWGLTFLRNSCSVNFFHPHTTTKVLTFQAQCTIRILIFPHSSSSSNNLVIRFLIMAYCKI